MSSSSSLELESECRRLVHFVVEHADGSEEIIPEGGMALVAGANLGFSIPEDTDEAVLEVDPLAGNEDSYYRTKYEGLSGLRPGESSSGAYVDDPRPAWLFTDESLYTASINSVKAEDVSGAVFVLGDACHSLGQFEARDDEGYPEEPIVWGEGSSAQEVGGQLSLFNMCIPCLDCLTFYRLEEYLERIKLFYDYVFALTYDNDTQNPPEHPDGGVRETLTGVHQQVMSARRYWDNILSRSMVKLSAQSFGQAIVGAGYYRNISDNAIGSLPDGVGMTFTFTFQKVDSLGVVTAWDGISASVTDVEILDREGRCSASIGPSGVTFVGSNQVVVQTITGEVLGPSKEFFSDVALVLLGTVDTNNPDYSYQVAVNLGVSHTHLGPVYDDNQVERNTLVYFRPPDPEPSS